MSPTCLLTKNYTKAFDSVNNIEVDAKTFKLTDKEVEYDWRVASTKETFSGFQQKFLILSARYIPFVMFSEEKLTPEVVKWIEDTTGLSFNVRGMLFCSLVSFFPIINFLLSFS